VSERPQYLPAEARRAATVQAVVDLAAEQNPAEITTTAIADRMGLTQGALFRHFPEQGRDPRGHDDLGERAPAGQRGQGG